MMKRVLVNVEFKDVYTSEKYEAGKTYPMTEARVAEVQKVNPNFISVVGTDEEYEDELKKAKAEAEAAKAELEALKAEKADTGAEQAKVEEKAAKKK